jgi:hypothetical protein
LNDIDPIEEAARQLLLTEARKQNPEIQPGEFIEKPLGGLEVGRIGAQTGSGRQAAVWNEPELPKGSRVPRPATGHSPP